MATPYSHTVTATADPPGQSVARRDRRRQETIEEALRHAIAIMSETGVGGLTVTEVARRMGMRGPSLYKYFPSLHALYDALFARGVAENAAAVNQALDGVPPGVEVIRVGTRATVRWCVENPTLSQLLYWRVVPGFEPSPETFAASREEAGGLRAMFAQAVQRGEVRPEADSDEAVRLLTVLISGIATQQMANQPGVSYDDGEFTALTDEALDLFFTHYGRAAAKGRH